MAKYIHTYIRLNLDLYLSLCTNIKPKQTKDLNITTEALHLLEDKICKTLGDIGIGKDFLNITSAAKEL